MVRTWPRLVIGALALLGAALSYAQAPPAIPGPGATTTAATSTVVVTGANRGLGFEFARQYAARGWKVIATARNPDEARALRELAADNPQVRIEALDVADMASVDAFAARLEGEPVDVLINNAGVFGDPSKFQLGSIDHGEFDKFFRTNSLGPLKVTEALLPNLRAGRARKVTAITSLAGSFAYAENGPPMRGHYYYRASKAALDLILVILASDLRAEGFTVVALSPGQVDTAGIGLRERGVPGIVDIERSVGGMIDVLERVTPAESGGYFRWSGEPLQW
jgi:NAD(P)-dependent dehydrogenase (short-subunit alcohol dehydrogenase family)